MTLSEVIKKYEGVKRELTEREYYVFTPTQLRDSIGIVDQFLKDLNSINECQPSWVTVRDKILSAIDMNINDKNYKDAQILAQTLSILPV